MAKVANAARQELDWQVLHILISYDLFRLLVNHIRNGAFDNKDLKNWFEELVKGDGKRKTGSLCAIATRKKVLYSLRLAIIEVK